MTDPAFKDFVLKKLIEAATTEDYRGIVAAPPRVGKTRSVAEFIPWYVEKFSGKAVLFVSYSGTVSSGVGDLGYKKLTKGAGQNLLKKGNGSSFQVWVRDGQRCATFTSVKSPLSGISVDLIIIDDAIKSSEEAYSQNHMSKLKEHYLRGIRCRLSPKGSVFVIGSRMGENDFIGEVPKLTDEQWDINSVPLVRESYLKPDPLNRHIGQSMDFPFDTGEFRTSVGIKAWDTIFQQRVYT